MSATPRASSRLTSAATNLREQTPAAGRDEPLYIVVRACEAASWPYGLSQGHPTVKIQPVYWVDVLNLDACVRDVPTLTPTTVTHLIATLAAARLPPKARADLARVMGSAPGWRYARRPPVNRGRMMDGFTGLSINSTYWALVGTRDSLDALVLETVGAAHGIDYTTAPIWL